jgi:maltose alpha-D-glucosyltransferase/alpha-amylase
MSDAATVDLWWKNTLVYCLDTKTWLDGDGDGIGDFTGLTASLDYLAGLGVTCLWLLPVCPSPWRDDGYDIADYYAVDPRLGTLGDFVSMVHAAHAAGIRVVLDLPLNHTSNEHAWFQQARADRGSRYRDFYVWRDEPPPNPPAPVFPGEQDSTCTYDPAAGQYYLHRYYDFMPELNTGNPQLRQELYKILGFWLAMGVDGFRMDSVPFLIEEIDDESGEDASHEFLRDLRSFVARRRGDAVLIGEANLPVDQLARYFGDDAAEEMQVLFDFLSCAGIWSALAQRRATPLADQLRRRPAAPPACQYLTFLRHHDELSLEHVLPHDEAGRIFDTFAPHPADRAYDRGIRRRLAPMLDADRDRLRLALSLLLSMPGAPVLCYGDELGIGDNADLPGRLAARTLMQWNDRDNGGFSPADPDTLIRPPLPDGPFGYKNTNVAAHLKDPDSALNWLRRATATRRQSPEIGTGRWQVLDTADDRVLAIRYTGQHDLIVIHNLGAEPATVHLDELDGADDILADHPYPNVAGDGIALNANGFRWLRLHRSSTQVT